MTPAGIAWQTPPSALIAGLDDYAKRLRQGVLLIGNAIAESMQRAAQAGADWVDRTRQAREGLRGFAVATAMGVIIYLVGLAPHNIFLELGTIHMAPRPIILPVLEAHYPVVMAAARRLVGA
jgi:hypothetical protein